MRLVTYVFVRHLTSLQQSQKKAADSAAAAARAEKQASEGVCSLDEARVRCSTLEVENATLRALTQDVHSEGAEAAGRCKAAFLSICDKNDSFCRLAEAESKVVHLDQALRY
jgi:hypothetical protein